MHLLKKHIPEPIYRLLAPLYHHVLAWLGALRYGFPSRNIRIIAVTGTKGKSSVCELVNGILEHAGYKTALASTIRFKIGEHSEANKLKMTMPGRFFLQRFLAKAVRAQCDFAIIEMTSEGARQFRHIGIATDALIFTNLAPEHIESHGSFEKYFEAKLSLGKALVKSRKRPRIMIANSDDEYGPEFLKLPVDIAVPYSLSFAKPWSTSESGTDITYDSIPIHSPMPGEFTAYNMVAAAVCAHAFGISNEHIRAGLENTRLIPGRVQSINAGQNFEVIIDYAHTLESLQKLYEAFPNRRKICVLGNTGGGRDTWKRPKMAALAEHYCDHVILTDEDPYDEDPEKIIEEMKSGMQTNPTVIMDRRRAIRVAIERAYDGFGDAVIISGKGTDPFIMRTNGAREPWSDANVATEELTQVHTERKSSN